MQPLTHTFNRQQVVSRPVSTFWLAFWAVAIDDDRQRREIERRRRRQARAQAQPKPGPGAAVRPV